ncbi:hypothetical protein K488DRAFT_82943 [Vararia minispora EC-137]|uniref:Uncharacterized protein n=1 Tax=Vararia minispora EC-137 TaxID=1314806 RepID=A0ACB8QUQ6_9AGAM|nr:hypothetical protein K488DRAFT_82943 [Vararia minispora EC-137]
MTTRFTPSRPASRAAHTLGSPVALQRPPTRDQRDAPAGTYRPLNLSGFVRKSSANKALAPGTASRAKVLQQLKPRSSDGTGIDLFKAPPPPNAPEERSDTFTFTPQAHIRQPMPRPALRPSPPLRVKLHDVDAPENADDSGYVSADAFFRLSDIGSDDHISNVQNPEAGGQSPHISTFEHSLVPGGKGHEDFHAAHAPSPASREEHTRPSIINVDDEQEAELVRKRAHDYHPAAIKSREAKRRRSDQPLKSFFNPGPAAPAPGSILDAGANISANPPVTQQTVDALGGLLGGIDLTPDQMEHLSTLFDSECQRWQQVSIEEWQGEADVLQQDFGSLLGSLLKRMTGKLELYNNLSTHLAGRRDILDQRARDLTEGRLALMRESDNVVRSGSEDFYQLED